MLLTPTSENRTKPSETAAPVPGATAVFEAATAEEALARVHAELGPDARIVDACRVRRGGIGGFFAREVVQMHAAPGSPPNHGPAPAVADPAAAPAAADATAADPTAAAPVGDPAGRGWIGAHGPAGGGSDAPIDRLIADAQSVSEATDFATFLRQQIGHGADAADQGATAGVAEPGAPSASAPPTVVNGSAPVTPVAWPTVPPAPAPEVRPEAAGAAAATPPPGPGHAEGSDATEDPSTQAGASAAEETVVAETVVDEAAGEGADAEEAGTATDSPGAADVEEAVAAETAARVGTLDVTAPGPIVDEDGPAWSATTLVRMGLPSELVRSIELFEPGDDVAWTYGLASALRPLCRPLPTGRSLLMGPCARSFGGRLGVTVVRVGDTVRARGDVAAGVSSPETGGAWLERVARTRWLHLVVGGVGWRELLAADPLAISWAKPADVAEAVRCSYELGLVLGHGPVASEVRRARPLDVALAIRDLVPRR